MGIDMSFKEIFAREMQMDAIDKIKYATDKYKIGACPDTGIDQPAYLGIYALAHKSEKCDNLGLCYPVALLKIKKEYQDILQASQLFTQEEIGELRK